MYTIKPPKIVKALYHELEWRINTNKPEIFLSFDDGPVPEITPAVLKILNEYNAKATFFCIGHNVDKYPGIYKSILEDGHTTGNHTYNHLNGWKTPRFTYLRNTLQCAELVKTSLFRPPYGKISRAQARAIRSRYRVIMWDVLSGDFDKNITKEKCLHNVIANTSAGSIIVFHDSYKAADKVLYALPRVLEYFSNKGFSFRSIEN
jgi:peptidoglycan-N-acetylglucosamine deacetylase